MSAGIEKRRVIVTGGAGGLGPSIAARFAELGAQVLVVDVHPETEARVKKMAGGVKAFRYDLAEPDCGQRILDAARDLLGGCDAIINNAAWSLHCLIEEMQVKDLDRLIGINQRAPYLLVQAFTRGLDIASVKPPDPCVVNISSANATSGNPRLIAYAGTKGAIEAMTRAMAVELAPRGIRVNAVRPGAIDTEQFRGALATYDQTEFWRDILIKSPISPPHIADVVVFLCGASARHVTGAVWTIDGGFGAH